MRWKTKDKTYGIEKPAQHFVSWFLRISVSPLCPPPPPTPASLCPLPSFPSIPYPFLSPLSPLSPFFSLLYPFSPPLPPLSPLSPLSPLYLIFTSRTVPTLLLGARFYFHTLIEVPPLLSPTFPATIVILWPSFSPPHTHASCFQVLPFTVPFPPSLVSSFISLLFHPFSVSLSLSLSLLLAPPQFTPVPSRPPSYPFFFFGQASDLTSLRRILQSFVYFCKSKTF